MTEAKETQGVLEEFLDRGIFCLKCRSDNVESETDWDWNERDRIFVRGVECLDCGGDFSILYEMKLLGIDYDHIADEEVKETIRENFKDYEAAYAVGTEHYCLACRSSEHLEVMDWKWNYYRDTGDGYICLKCTACEFDTCFAYSLKIAGLDTRGPRPAR